MIDIKLRNSNYCLNSASYILFKLKNGDKVQLKHQSKVDCGQSSNLISHLSEDLIKRLTSSAITFARFYNTDNYIDIEVISDPNYFIDNLKCLD